jgi:hypothetical protein
MSAYAFKRIDMIAYVRTVHSLLHFIDDLALHDFTFLPNENIYKRDFPNREIWFNIMKRFTLYEGSLAEHASACLHSISTTSKDSGSSRIKRRPVL